MSKPDDLKLDRAMAEALSHGARMHAIPLSDRRELVRRVNEARYQSGEKPITRREAERWFTQSGQKRALVPVAGVAGRWVQNLSPEMQVRVNYALLLSGDVTQDAGSGISKPASFETRRATLDGALEYMKLLHDHTSTSRFINNQWRRATLRYDASEGQWVVEIEYDRDYDEATWW